MFHKQAPLSIRFSVAQKYFLFFLPRVIRRHHSLTHYDYKFSLQSMEVLNKGLQFFFDSGHILPTQEISVGCFRTMGQDEIEILFVQSALPKALAGVVADFHDVRTLSVLTPQPFAVLLAKIANPHAKST